MPPRTKNGDCIKVEDVENTPGSKYEQSPDSARATGSRRALHQHTVWSWQGGALDFSYCLIALCSTYSNTSITQTCCLDKTSLIYHHSLVIFLGEIV